MEIVVARADNVPDGCMLALTAGQSRRLAPLVSKQKFAFSTEAAAAAASEGGQGMKVEVLMIKGIARIDASQLKAGVIGAGHTKKGHKLEVPLKIGSELAMFDRPAAELPPMRVALSVRPVSEKHGRDPTRSREAAVRAKARVVSPGVEGKDVGPQPARSLMKEAAPRRASPSPNPNPKQPVRGKHTIALEARTYLEDHHIFNFIEDMMRLLVKEKPIDPWSCIAGLFPGGKDKLFSTRQNTSSTVVPPSEAATLAGCTRESWFTTSGRQELAAMAEEEEEAPLPPPACAPEEGTGEGDAHASPRSGAQLLRKLARDQLADALGSGQLQRALQQVQKDQMQLLRQRTRETLLRAGMCGTLASQLETLWGGPPEVVGEEDVHGIAEEELLEEEEEESDTDPAQIERVLPGHRLDRALGDFTPTSERAFSCVSEGDGTAQHEALNLLERAKAQAHPAGLPQRPQSTASTAALSADSGGTLASAARDEARHLLACVGDLTAKAAPLPSDKHADDEDDGEASVIVRSNSFQTEGSAALSEARRLVAGVDLSGLQEDGVIVRSNSFSTAASAAQSEARNIMAQVAFREAPSDVPPPAPVPGGGAEEADAPEEEKLAPPEEEEVPEEAAESLPLSQEKLVQQVSEGEESLPRPQGRVPPGATLTLASGESGQGLAGWEGEGSRPVSQATNSVASVQLGDAKRPQGLPAEDAAEQEAVDTMLHQAVADFARSAAGSLERVSVGPSEQMAYTLANTPNFAATGSIKTASHPQTTTVAHENTVQDLVPSLLLRQLEAEAGTPSVRSLVSYAHTAVALAHETVQLSEQGLSVSIKVQNVDYFALVADTSLLSAFEAATKQAIAAEAGEGILPEYVVLQLSAGSVVIDATIVPPIGFSAKELQSKLATTGALSSSVLAQLSQIERIDTVASGPLVISAFKVEESDTKAAIAAVTRQVEEASRKRQEEDEAQRLIEEELRKRREEERTDQQKQAAERSRQKEEAERAAAEAEEAAAKAVEEELRKRREEEAAQLQRAEEERRQAEEAAAARRREEDEAAAQLVREEQARKQHEEEEAVRRRWAEQEEAERLTDEEAAKAAAELLWRQQLEEAEEQRARALADAQQFEEEEGEQEVDLRCRPPEASEADGKADSEALAAEHARLEAEEAEKALAAEHTRLQAEEAEKALAAEHARLAAEEAEKALAAERARLQAEEAEKEAAQAAQQRQLEMERAAEEEAAQRRQLQMERAAEEAKARRTPETPESRRQAEKEAAERRRQAEREVEEAEAVKRMQALMQSQEAQSRYDKEVGDRHDRQAREAQRIQEEMQKLSQELETRHDADDYTTGTLTPPAMKPVSSSDLEEINVGDRIEVINSLYLDQEGVEVLAGWTGIVQEMNDGDAVVLFFGMQEGRYVLKEDFGNLIVSKADVSVTSCSESLLRQEVGQALQQNETLRAQNAALKLELDRLLGSCTPSSATPPVTGGTRRVDNL